VNKSNSLLKQRSPGGWSAKSHAVAPAIMVSPQSFQNFSRSSTPRSMSSAAKLRAVEAGSVPHRAARLTGLREPLNGGPDGPSGTANIITDGIGRRRLQLGAKIIF
jgi:hypothetical protein